MDSPYPHDNNAETVRYVQPCLCRVMPIQCFQGYRNLPRFSRRTDDGCHGPGPQGAKRKPPRRDGTTAGTAPDHGVPRSRCHSIRYGRACMRLELQQHRIHRFQASTEPTPTASAELTTQASRGGTTGRSSRTPIGLADAAGCLSSTWWDGEPLFSTLSRNQWPLGK